MDKFTLEEDIFSPARTGFKVSLLYLAAYFVYNNFSTEVGSLIFGIPVIAYIMYPFGLILHISLIFCDFKNILHHLLKFIVFSVSFITMTFIVIFIT